MSVMVAKASLRHVCDLCTNYTLGAYDAALTYPTFYTLTMNTIGATSMNRTVAIAYGSPSHA